MSTWQERHSAAVSFESELIDKLVEMGWPSFPFGQAQLSDDCRDRLKDFEDSARRPSLIRWMPDIITFRDMRKGRSFVSLIDAKTCSDKYPNYSLEISAIDTAMVFTDHLYTPTFFVFDDWKVLTPREARQRGKPGPDNNDGSGTPYVLVSKRFGRPIEEVFPPLIQKKSAA